MRDLQQRADPRRDTDARRVGAGGGKFVLMLGEAQIDPDGRTRRVERGTPASTTRRGAGLGHTRRRSRDCRTRDVLRIEGQVDLSSGRARRSCRRQGRPRWWHAATSLPPIHDPRDPFAHANERATDRHDELDGVHERVANFRRAVDRVADPVGPPDKFLDGDRAVDHALILAPL